jgi:nucleoside-diphosphate-sugar epimerase
MMAGESGAATTVPGARGPEFRGLRILVTGSAGFLGSHAVEALAARGHTVYGLDAFTDTYDVTVKRDNHELVADMLAGFAELDITTDPLDGVVGQAEVVVHLAATPGVRASWGSSFVAYVDANVLGTQRLLDAACRTGARRFVHASSSSVYGDTGSTIVDESAPHRPVSPYGVTKVAAEALGQAYAASWNLEVVALRFFTVYGPRQRPDMAIARAIAATHGGRPFTRFGDGSQRRSFTFVADAVRGIVGACQADVHAAATALNISGPATHAVNEMLAAVEASTGKRVPVVDMPVPPGDPSCVHGSIRAAAANLGWRPEVALEDGIDQQVAWWSASRVRVARG